MINDRASPSLDNGVVRAEACGSGTMCGLIGSLPQARRLRSVSREGPFVGRS